MISAISTPSVAAARRRGTGHGQSFQGGIEAGAMPALHRYLGNPVLSFLGRLFFRIELGDFHCGLRGFNAAEHQRR